MKPTAAPLLVMALACILCLSPRAASATNLCTVIADAVTGQILLEDGDCRTRVTPASTFKIPLALIGYDAGFLDDAQTPALAFREGYAAWGGNNWTQTTTPTRWMKYSVVWYSQQITRALGVDKLSAYTDAFGYGNSDWSGDPGKNNALDRAWISSSLKISPMEQVSFLAKLVRAELPVSVNAVANTMDIVETAQAGGWIVHGKTGSAYPRNRDDSFDRARGWGWFVGWATRGERTLIFARLDQDERRHELSGGLRAREAFLRQWPTLANHIGQ